MGTESRFSAVFGRPSSSWTFPLAAGAAMLVPVNLWDLALERELTSAALRGVCIERGIRPVEADVVRARDNILRAIVRGHSASWLFNACFITSYLGAPVVLNAAMTAWVSHVTRRIAQRHLSCHAGLDTLSESAARADLLELLRWPRLPRTVVPT